MHLSVCVGVFLYVGIHYCGFLSTSINSLKFLIVYTFISGLGEQGENRDGDWVRRGTSRTVKGAATFVVLCKMHKHSA